MVYHLAITGSRRGPTEAQRKVLTAYMRATSFGPHEVVFHHGDCIGVDAVGHDIACGLWWTIIVHPPANPKARAFRDGHITLPERPYLKRNQEIVTCCSELVACPKESTKLPRGTRGSGTWYTIYAAIDRGRIVHIIYPDGSTETINPPKERK